MKNYDYILIIITIGLLVALGLIFIYGTGFSFLASKSNPAWTATLAYPKYLDSMNQLALPFALGLVVVLGLCIPKRIIPRSALLWANGFLVLLALLLAWLFDLKVGLGFLLITALLLQAVVVILVLAGSKDLRFEQQSFFVQLGSALLHLGLIVFVLDIVLLQKSAYHLFLFWLATFSITVGSALSFYSDELTRLRQQLESRGKRQDRVLRRA